MQELEWKTSCGCAKCRPALNYYLVCAWPGEYADDYQSRFINERVHANIQKDGTYSVVPRMWGGVTSAKELRAIADVVDKFDIPTVKVTGGQRIDLLGVKKEDLPAVWADLSDAGIVSGHAYAKGLRTVKTCVGTDWCRFGTQDSTGLGVKLEKFMWGSWTPAKVKMAVSGCPRNCAEATCKDVGVDLRRLRLRDPFRRRRRPRHQGHGGAGPWSRPRTRRSRYRGADPALPRAGALSRAHLQMGQARRPRRDPPPDHRRPRAAQRASTTASSSRQKFAQVDPWAERVAGKDKHEFRPLADGRLRAGGGVSAMRLDRDRRDRRHSRCAARAACRRRTGEIAVFRTADDEVFALDDRCPHKGGPLSQGIVHGAPSPARCTTG